jgi:hypothetical protein
MTVECPRMKIGIFSQVDESDEGFESTGEAELGQNSAEPGAMQ